MAKSEDSTEKIKQELTDRQTAEKKPNAILSFFSSLRFQVTIVTVLLVALISFAIGFIVTQHEKASLTREVEIRVLTQARSIATSTERYMVLPDPEMNMLRLIRETMNRDEDIISITITDPDDTVIAHPEVVKIDKTMVYPEGTETVTGLGFLQMGESVEEGDGFFVVSAPVTRLYEGEIQYLGRVYIEFSKQKITDVIVLARQQVFFISGLVAIAGLLIALILSNLMIRPIYKLAEAARLIGYGELDVEINVRGHNEIAQLARTLSDTTHRLKNATDELVAKERLDRELEIAREIQSTLLPSNFPEVESLDIAGVCESATEVGGDYYDVFEVGPNRLGVLVADVSGKGVPGLLVIGVARSVLRSQARENISAAETLIRANDIITPDIRAGMFITALYGIIDTKKMTFTFANAGHNPLIVVSNEMSGREPITEYKTNGRPLGFMTGQFFDDRIVEQTIDLMQGDSLLIYTDGVFEAMNPEFEEYGMERFNTELVRSRNANAGQVVSGVLEDVRNFAGNAAQSDDITILAIRVGKEETLHSPDKIEQNSGGEQA